jgi:hypothetical protein
MSDPYREPIEEPAAAPPKIEKPAPFEAEKAMQKIREIPSSAPAQETPKPTPAPPVSTPPPSVPEPAPTPAPPPPAPKKESLKDLNEDRQMKTLVDMAFQQGIDKAVEAARATGQAYLIDKLHDTLIDELRQQLIEKGKLKEA